MISLSSNYRAHIKKGEIGFRPEGLLNAFRTFAIFDYIPNIEFFAEQLQKLGSTINLIPALAGAAH